MLNLILDAEPVQQVAGWSQADMWMGLGMVALFGAVMYFMIYLPQKKRDPHELLRAQETPQERRDQSYR